MKRTHAYKPEKSKSQPIPQPISSDQAQSATPVPPPLQAKTNEEGLAEWKAQQEKWERFGTPWKDKVPNPSGELVQPWIQRKLTLGQPGDKYEQEADRVASQVVQQINAPSLSQFNQGQSVQQEKELEGGMQAKSLRAAIQRRQAMTDEEASADLESAINSARGSGKSLDARLQRSMGQVMGADFSEVKVHTDTQSDQLNQSIQARAFTTGQDVFFREGAYQPGDRGGQELIAHELTHVVQQVGTGNPINSKNSQKSGTGGFTQKSLSDELIQRALWTNAPAKFRTDNGNDQIPNSEYKVGSGGYQRYAPINIHRNILNQVYHEGPRSFVYIRGETEQSIKGKAFDALWDNPWVTGKTGDEVYFNNDNQTEAKVTAYITPQEGDTVYDLNVAEDGKGSGQHVGHEVEDLGQALPTLDDSNEHAKVKKQYG
ncbi:eCIS core domain-containing protein [Acaryochloris marina]|uniref:eCIS core domain-containing protein n=1 Tax=Acaryochloris marina (strain MBIC 11017) TaxID=329726 RepID=A8ZQC5_ACAM1|nr:DUF4157 domain-containing protein [Acaryochloris marina]ABW33211.1 conserved hypothetical protein [Acaryochloris marina MBIC11017]